MDPVASGSKRRRALPLLIPAISGILLALAYPPLGAWPLAWAALAPWYATLVGTPDHREGTAVAGAATDTGSVRRRLVVSLLSGLVLGFVLFLTGMVWMTEIGVAPYVILSLIQAVPFAILGAIAGLLLPRLPAACRPWVFAALWTLFEALRSTGRYAFPWFMLAASQVREPAMIQLAAVTGQWGVSFAIAAAGGLLGEAWIARRAPRVRNAQWGMALALPLLLYAGGAVAMRDTSEPAETTRRVAAAQGNFVKPGRMYPEEARVQVLRIYNGLTYEAADRGAELVVWPETVVPGILLRDTQLYQLVTGLARSSNASLLVGAIDVDGQRRLYNAALLIGRDGNIAGRYDKTQLVPIGEFFPLRAVLGSFYRAYGAPAQDMTPGRGNGVMSASGPDGRTMRLGALICYESAFGRLAAARARNGAEVLIVLTSDQTFGTTAGPYQHLDLSPLRAVETRRWLLRAASTGVSATVDPWGRIQERLGLDRSGVVVGSVHLRRGNTLYARWGEWFLGVCGLLVLAGGAAAGSALRRECAASRPAGTPPP